MPPTPLAPGPPRRRRPRPRRAPVGDNGGGRHRRPADTGGPAPLPGPPPPLPHRPPGAALAPKAPGQTVRRAAPRLLAGRRCGAVGAERGMLGSSPWAGFPAVENLLPTCGSGAGTCPAAAPGEGRCASGVTPVNAREGPAVLSSEGPEAPRLPPRGKAGPKPSEARPEAAALSPSAPLLSGRRLLTPHRCPGAAASHVGPNRPQRVTGSPRPPAPPLLPMPSPHPTTALSGTVSPGNEPRAGDTGDTGWGAPAQLCAGPGGALPVRGRQDEEGARRDPRVLVLPFLAPGRRPSAITGAAVEGGPGVPAAPRLRHRLVPWLNASPRKMSLELVLP